MVWPPIGALTRTKFVPLPTPSGVPWGVACRTAPGVVAPAILTGVVGVGGVAGAGAVFGVSADVVGVAPGVGNSYF